MSDRDRRLAELMGMCWPDNQGWPDFSYPEWRARLMDWAVEQEWWSDFYWWASHKLYTGNYNSITGEKIMAFIWRNLPELVDEYHKEGR